MSKLYKRAGHTHIVYLQQTADPPLLNARKPHNVTGVDPEAVLRYVIFQDRCSFILFACAIY